MKRIVGDGRMAEVVQTVARANPPPGQLVVERACATALPCG